MKLYAIAGALCASTLAVPVHAQAWYDPSTLIHNGYVEVEGGAAVQGRTKIQITASGLGAGSQSASQDDKAFGGALVGYKLADPVAVEVEGVYSRNNLYYTPNNPIFGIGGATRTYGGLANLRFSLPFTPTYTLPFGAHPIAIGISPYISPGAGYGNIQYTGRNGIFSYSDNQDGFMWQAKAGVELRTGNHLALDIAYRYLQSPQYDRSGYFNSPNYTALTRSHIQAATVGLKYYF